jgi:hypothetical protein
MPGNDCTGPSRSASERFGAPEALAGRSTVSVQVAAILAAVQS